MNLLHCSYIVLNVTLIIYSIAALDCAKVTAENSEFARSFRSDYTTSVEEQTISATNSDLTVNGCYIHHGIAEEDLFNQALGGK